MRTILQLCRTYIDQWLLLCCVRRTDEGAPGGDAERAEVRVLRDEHLRQVQHVREATQEDHRDVRDHGDVLAPHRLQD